MATLTVLVLDDNPQFVRALAVCARTLGLEVTATEDPEAFPALVSRGDVIAAVVDCMLGDRSGLSLLSVIAAKRPDLPTLVVSGYGDGLLGQASQVARSHGLVRFSTLAKPFTTAALRRFLEGARADVVNSQPARAQA